MADVGGGAKAIINIDVPDRARAEAFYTAAFELRVARRLGDDFVELVGAPVTIYLLEKAAGIADTLAGEATRRHYDRHWTPVHFDWCVEDLDAAIARAVAAGALLEGTIRVEPYGRIQQLADPFGHGFCLIEFSERGYDAIATG
jgi:predicted enzyme related to lactoylglutathione lyase